MVAHNSDNPQIVIVGADIVAAAEGFPGLLWIVDDGEEIIAPLWKLNVIFRADRESVANITAIAKWGLV